MEENVDFMMAARIELKQCHIEVWEKKVRGCVIEDKGMSEGPPDGRPIQFSVDVRVRETYRPSSRLRNEWLCTGQ